ncbi:MAG: PIN domain-containing protein [Actinobacteria bacterium]|nr:PIN domain-containing protein [Actinomycetota bacterium]
MTVFVDTSALFALLDAEDAEHDLAFSAWSSGIDDCAGFVTTNYVVVETIALVQRRLGIDAVRTLIDEMLPMIDTIWVTEADHTTGLSLVLMAARRHLSLVDCVSFTVMRRMGIRKYLGLDPHFEEQGFTRYAAG